MSELKRIYAVCENCNIVYVQIEQTNCSNCGKETYREFLNDLEILKNYNVRKF
jgi:rRNA maturation endonuclease Nob1